MGATFNKRLSIVWLVLSAITLLYLWIDHSSDHDGALGPSALVTTSAIVLSLVKVRIIFREFMEVHQAPAVLSRLTDGWVVLMGICLLGACLIGVAAPH